MTAAAIAVPIAKKMGLGSVLGYLIAGIIIGPFCLSLIGDIEEVMHFTEFGVVMMLFLVGLELKPSLLWQMRTPILGMGGVQVVLSSIIIGGVSLIFLPWQQGIAIGLILSLSSTAIVLQTLREKGLMETSAGRSATLIAGAALTELSTLVADTAQLTDTLVGHEKEDVSLETRIKITDLKNGYAVEQQLLQPV